MEKTCKNCDAPIAEQYCEDNYPEVCEHWAPKKIKTNGDYIRAMSDERLAEYVGKICLCSHIQTHNVEHCDSRLVCTNCVSDWLKQPMEE